MKKKQSRQKRTWIYTVPELKAMARQILAKEKNEKKIKGKALVLIEKGGWDNSCLGTMLLRHSGKSTSNSEFSAVVCKMADSELWYVREIAASLLKDLLLNDFDYFFGLLKKMVKDKNPNIRRAAIVGSMQSKLNEKQAVKVAQLIYRPLLNDENVYVRKNLGPFAVSQFLRLYPKAALAFFDKEMKLHGLTCASPEASARRAPVGSSPFASVELKSAETEVFRIHPRLYSRGLLRRRMKTLKPRPVWNILNAFQTARFRANKDLIAEARKYLKLVADSQERTIIAAAASLKRRLDSL